MSICNVQTIVASNGDTYYSNQFRYTDTFYFSGATMVGFKNSNCEGIPAIQANTIELPLLYPLNECSLVSRSDVSNEENGFIAYVRTTLQRYAVGNPFDTYAAKFVQHAQTDTCDSEGLELNAYFRSGTCQNMFSTENASYAYVPGQGAINVVEIEYYPCANCECGMEESIAVRDNVCVNDDQDDDQEDDQEDDAFFDDLQVETMSGYKEETSHYLSYALPQTCLWSTGCSNSPGGKLCEVGTYCKEYQWWSQCLENTVNNSQPQVFNPDKKCISTRNGHGPNAHWGCEYNADCCNPQAVCNAYSRTCNLPCEAMTEPESLSISNDAVLSGSSLVVLVPVVAGVGLFTVLASLSLYYYGFICRRGADTKSREFESQSEMTVIVDSETAVHVLE